MTENAQNNHADMIDPVNSNNSLSKATRQTQDPAAEHDVKKKEDSRPLLKDDSPKG